ncbi:MAG: replicative DNA helicase [Caulobacteraceae bacterium]|nr:replicative DNA helicase [Caulobacteraceae bacterium]
MTAPLADLAAEQAVLGALLCDPAAGEGLCERLTAASFFEPLHGRIFAGIERRLQSGRRADAGLVAADLGADAALAEAGGARYLGDLIDQAPTLPAAREHAERVRDLWLRRALVAAGGEAAARAGDLSLPAEAQIEAAERALFALAAEGPAAAGFKGAAAFAREAAEAASRAYAHAGSLVGVPTGLADLDRKLGGLHPSDLVILGGRPSMGKSALAGQIGARAAAAGTAVGIFSLEMSGAQWMGRLIAERAGLASDRLRRGEIDRSEHDRAHGAAAELSRLPLFIDETGALSIGRLAARARRLQRREGLGLVIVDYLQLIAPEARRREANRVQELTEITGALKALAKDLSLPVLALSQLSRQVEMREDKRPQLADLRDSGAIEQDADVVLFLWREAYYLARAEPREGTAAHLAWEERMAAADGRAELVIAKQRHGPIGTVRLAFDEALTRFSSAGGGRGP